MKRSQASKFTGETGIAKVVSATSSEGFIGMMRVTWACED